MTVRLILTSMLVLFCRSLLTGQDLRKFNVREAVNYGLNNHRRISEEKKNLEYREWLTRKEKSNYLPSVNVSADYRYNTNLPVTILPAEAFGQTGNGPLEIQMGARNSLQGGVNLEQEIYNPVILSRINEKEIQKNMAEVNMAAIKKSVALEIKKSYYQAVLNFEVWKASKDLLQNYNNLEKVVRVKFKNGLISENDLDKIIKKKQNQSEELKINIMKFHNSIKSLRMSMDYPVGKDLSIKDSLVILLSSYALTNLSDTFAYRKLPEYRDLSLQENLNKARISTLSKRYYPSINLTCSLGSVTT
ncbi:MAG: TolC family protein [Bacteroidota bacterium]